MTYMFEFRLPKLEPNSEEAEKEKTRLKAVRSISTWLHPAYKKHFLLLSPRIR